MDHETFIALEDIEQNLSERIDELETMKHNIEGVLYDIGVLRLKIEQILDKENES